MHGNEHAYFAEAPIYAELVRTWRATGRSVPGSVGRSAAVRIPPISDPDAIGY